MVLDEPAMMGEPNAEVNKMAEETEGRQPSANKNGKKAEGGSGSTFFTWFMVLALLGVWTSVAVVWFELVDYDDVLARAKEFRYNISEVLQGKLGAYDADGDGDFDVEDARVLLGLTEKPAATVSGGSEDAQEPPQPASAPSVESEPELEAHSARHGAQEADRAPPAKPFGEKGCDMGRVEEVVAEEEEEEEEEEIAEEEEAEVVEEEPELQVEEEEELEEEEEEAEAAPFEEEEEEEAAPLEEVMAVTTPVEEAFKAEVETGVKSEEPREAEDYQAVPVIEEEAEVSEAVNDYLFEGEHLPREEEPDIQDAFDDSEDVSDVYGSQNMDVESEIQAVPLPEVQEDVPDSERHVEDTIDTKGELVEDLHPEETVAHSVDSDVSLDGSQADEAELVEDLQPEETVAHSVDSDVFLDGSQTDEAGEPAAEVSHEQLTEVEASLLEDQPQAESSDEPVLREDPHQEGPTETAEAQQEEKPKVQAKKKKPKLLNKFDKTIKAEIDAAESLRKKGRVEEAVRAFEALVQRHPQSPRSRYGKAQSEDDLAEKMRSNEVLQRAVVTYGEVADLPDVPADLVRVTLKRRAERQQFLGRMRGALLTLEKLVQIFSEDISLKNDLGVGYLLMGDNESAKKVYEQVLAAAPDDGFAKVHYGFILKSENKIAESIPFLREGLESGAPGTDDGRFYFHLGDALQRVGDDSAYKWYELGHQRGHFASVWQRSLYNVNGLRAQPWWTAKETGYTHLVKTLERNWKTIRDEALSVVDAASGLFLPEDENLRETGEWGQFTLWQQGRKVEKSCQSVPKTCALMERFPESTGCKRGQVKYSVMQPGTHVWPHTGPTNCRLRMHLGLVIPARGCRIRCTNETRTWEEGRVLIFDDSFEHEVWQEADSYRLIFIVDVWHPELTQYQRQTLSPI
ncbi:aspartyl/asparaginyl beta-hydroxylase isoform X2 [Brienomyrus brachyistius]|uniref:aspartyl/asparaginyl beta-hydroxylase isoform X2 n=1 Tax=Brienomyrus brachyistius TaxID=42636 RepID=UPI0020B1D7E7|nr:aspartyl/asparaginyl beta-hydroxylase isoform X2 [Brienomyrus brachyistius]